MCYLCLNKTRFSSFWWKLKPIFFKSHILDDEFVTSLLLLTTNFCISYFPPCKSILIVMAKVRDNKIEYGLQ